MQKLMEMATNKKPWSEIALYFNRSEKKCKTKFKFMTQPKKIRVKKVKSLGTVVARKKKTKKKPYEKPPPVKSSYELRNRII
jgi:hypothetical protein